MQVKTFIRSGCRVTVIPDGAWKHECAKCGRNTPRRVWEDGGMERTVHVVCRCGAKYAYWG